MKITALTVVALLAGGLAAAPAFASDVRVSGMGVRKCSEWLDWKNANNGEARATGVEWSKGFIAGHNVYSRLGREPVASVVADTRILLTLLDSYCEKNPGQRIVNAVVSITQSLGGAKVDLTPKGAGAPGPRPDRKLERES